MAENASTDLKIGWITNRLDESAIEFANSFASNLQKQKFTTSQFRNFYSEVKRIQISGLVENRQDFLMLKPKLAYATKRAKNKGADLFYKEILKALDAISSGEGDNSNKEAEMNRFDNFCDLLEAILAYHKFYGGKSH